MTADFDRERVDLAHAAEFQIGALEVRPSIRQVEIDGESETLEPRVMQVLVVLARRRGQVVSRDDLIQFCWEGRIVGEDAINRCTSRIRKLGQATRAFRLDTIPRVGYRLREAEAEGERGFFSRRRKLGPVAVEAVGGVETATVTRSSQKAVGVEAVGVAERAARFKGWLGAMRTHPRRAAAAGLVVALAAGLIVWVIVF